MKFEKFFRLISYAAVFCGFLSLWVSGTFGIAGTVLFGAVIGSAWLLEGSRWQISEKIGTALIILALPVFYLAYRLNVITFDGVDTVLPGVLARMILSLTAIKLLQKKSDRDWIFLYLMSFFEVLLAAGLSISALYLASFILYLLVMVCAVIAFEIRKTAYSVERSIAGEKAEGKDPSSEAERAFPIRRLPAAAVALIVFIVMLAAPLFFMLPRVGGAGFGGNQGGLSTSSGFSDTVRLGGIGRIQENNEIVMRVKVDPASEASGDLYFRGIALDTFDNVAWSKSKVGMPASLTGGEGGRIRVDQAAPAGNYQFQTYYVEPLDTSVIFALPRAVEVVGSFPSIDRDPYGALSHRRKSERISYSVVSDRSRPNADRLRADNAQYAPEMQNYRDLPPRFDLRITELASQIAVRSTNRYDTARAIEQYLQHNLGYTLEQKASGPEPLADFLFNVQEGHCEYFATAMAIMLRTQGIATRIVNGFHGGEYNDAAGMTIVRQRNAHAWVEVYFPGEKMWIRFDPTPSDGNAEPASTGIAGTLNKYIEAIETLWIQYFVTYDNQGQRTLARTVQSGFVDYQQRLGVLLGQARDGFAEWLSEVSGAKGFEARRAAVGYGLAYSAGLVVFLLISGWAVLKIRRLKLWTRLWERLARRRQASAVEFYDRLQRILAKSGVVRDPHKTPLEFAYETGLKNAVTITERYNRVRFGEDELSNEEAVEIDNWLKQIETAVDDK